MEEDKTAIYEDLGDGNPESGWEYYVDQYAIDAENPTKEEESNMKDISIYNKNKLIELCYKDLSDCDADEIDPYDILIKCVEHANKVYKEEPSEFYQIAITQDEDLCHLITTFGHKPIFLLNTVTNKIISKVESFHLTIKGFEVVDEFDQRFDIFQLEALNYDFLIYNI